MSYFGKFYLDKEKDVIVEIEMINHQMSYILRTPNHQTGNLITNLARVCELPIRYDEQGYKVICDKIPGYYDGNNQKVYILRMGNTKVANIYEDGTIERKAYIPAIAKTFMSQTKDYSLDIQKTLVKTYIREEVKFHTDLHTHRNANLSPDLCIALGIYHQIEYPYYYVKKLGLKLTKIQEEQLETQRKEVELEYKNSELTGKYLERRIDDHTIINFADLILNNLEDSSYNISKIRTSLAVLKDGQAVFTNLEKVYLYRYVFLKGKLCDEKIDISKYTELEDIDIKQTLSQMEMDRKNPSYANNSLYQDKLLWTARSYQKNGIYYSEISDTSLIKKSDAPTLLKEIHEVMPAIQKETGVLLRFLCAFRRIPLTIIKDQVNHNYFSENLQVLKAVYKDPYIAGCDFVGEEMNDINELKPVIRAIMEIVRDDETFVMRIHAGENDSLPDNVLNSVLAVKESLLPHQAFPNMRIGHGLYTENLNSAKGKQLLQQLRENRVVLEFQLSSNVRLNNLSSLKKHPLKQYLNANILCVQGSDGCALYGSDCIDEQLSLERMLELDFYDLKRMREAEDHVLQVSLQNFNDKKENFTVNDVKAYYEAQINSYATSFLNLSSPTRKISSQEALLTQIKELPSNKIPIVVAGGSFNNAHRKTMIKPEECEILDELLSQANPEKVFFVIGPTMTGYEKYMYEKGKNRFEIFAFVPSTMTEEEYLRVKKLDIPVRISIESSPWGTYKSFAFEIFKRRQSIILALDGNSAASNLIQDAKNSKYKSRTFISNRSRSLKSKADSLQGYVTMIKDTDSVKEIIKYLDKYYNDIEHLENQLYVRK